MLFSAMDCLSLGPSSGARSRDPLVRNDDPSYSRFTATA
jgi:hypothetical protein